MILHTESGAEVECAIGDLFEATPGDGSAPCTFSIVCMDKERSEFEKRPIVCVRLYSANVFSSQNGTIRKLPALANRRNGQFRTDQRYGVDECVRTRLLPLQCKSADIHQESSLSEVRM